MGQYHLPFAYHPQTQQLNWFHPYQLARGLKSWEQLDGNVGNCLSWLLAAAPGDAPADLAQFDPTPESGPRVIGSWAGSRILEAGDYADDADIADWKGPRLSSIYRLKDVGDYKPQQMPSKDGWHREMTRKEWRSRYETWLEQQRALSRYLPLTNHSKAVQFMFERVRHVRFHGDNWLDEASCKRPENFNKRLAARGQKRVLFNLDRNEYLDPAAFGAKPTTAGMVLCSRFGDALLTSFFQAEPRGGGDLPAEDKIPEAVRGWIGRWHGDRLIATPEKPVEAQPDWPTTAMVKTTGADVSQLARALVEHLHRPPADE